VSIALNSYQLPDPTTVTLCFFEWAPRVAMLDRWGTVRCLEVWTMRRVALAIIRTSICCFECLFRHGTVVEEEKMLLLR
jgi:hypothetical protein